MYVLVREDEAEQHKRELKNSIEPQIHQLLKLADEYGAEQEKLETQLRERVCGHPFDPVFHPSGYSLSSVVYMHRVEFVSERLMSSSSLRIKIKAYPKGSEPLRDGKSFCGNIEIGSEPRTGSKRKSWLSW